MIFGTCNIDSTYVKSKLRRFDILRAAKIETTVESILAAPDLRNGHGERVGDVASPRGTF